MYGCSGSLEDARQRPELGDPAGVHDGDLVGRLRDDAEVVRDEDDGGAVLALELADQVEDLRLDGDVERRRRLVGDQDLGLEDERHRDHHALAHPAGELVRVARRAARRRSGSRPPRAPRARGARAAFSETPLVRLDRLDDLPADPVERVERRERVLEDHRDALAAHARGARPAAASAGRRRRAAPRPSIVAFGSRVRPITVSAVTLFPEPDSPTMPSVRPRSTRERDAVDRLDDAVPCLEARRAGRGSRGVPSVPHPRVEERVEDVDEDVRGDDEEGAEEDGALDRRQVGVDDRVVGVAARSRGC